MERDGRNSDDAADWLLAQLAAGPAGPRTWPADQRTPAGSGRENSGNDSSQTSRATRISMRARCEPAHRWMPRPKAAWRLTSRSMITSSARSNSAGSRLAAGNDSRTQSFSFIGHPCQSMSSRTRRAIVTGA